MATTGLNYVKRIRREDLFRDDDAEEAEEAKGGIGGPDNEASAAARAALDAYMAQTLALDFSMPSAPAPAPAPKKAKFEPVVEEAAKTADDDSTEKKEDDSTSDDDDDDDNVLARSTAAAAAAPKVTEFAFRLFAAPRGPAAQQPAVAGSTASSSATVPGPDAPAREAVRGVATVVLLPDEIDGDESGAAAAAAAAAAGGLLNAPRPLSAYLADAPTPAERARYDASAVCGEDVLAQARPGCRNAWGWERPWRARTTVRNLSRDALLALLANAVPVPTSADTQAVLPVTEKRDLRDLARALHAAANRLPAWAGGSTATGSDTSDSQRPARRRRCRPGKNRRTMLHQRAQAVREKEAATAAARLSKEEHLLEKKKRLNRTKKLRRRAKKRATTSDAGDDGQSSRAASEEA